MRRPLRFAVADLPEGAKTVELEDSAERLDLRLSDDDLSLVTPVRVVATMIRSGKGVIGEGHAVSVGRFMCGRCLADFRLPLRGAFDVTFRPATTRFGALKPAATGPPVWPSTGASFPSTHTSA